MEMLLQKEKALHMRDLLGRSFILDLKSGERIHFKAECIEFDELIGFDQEMERRTLLVTDINTASRKGKVYTKMIVDIIMV